VSILFVGIDFAKQVLAVHSVAKCGKTALPRDKLFALGAYPAPCIRSAPNLVRMPGSFRSLMTSPGRDLLFAVNAGSSHLTRRVLNGQSSRRLHQRFDTSPRCSKGGGRT